MIEVNNNIKNGDQVIASKDFRMYNNVFANMGDVFEVKNISNNVVQLFNKGVVLTIDRNTFDEYFNVLVAHNDNNKYSSYKKNESEQNKIKDKYNKDYILNNINESECEVIYATAASLPNSVDSDSICSMLEDAEYEINTAFGKCVIVSCKLPNGFVITESATFSQEKFNEELGVDICMGKIEEKLCELEYYRIHNEIYNAEILDECLNCEYFENCDECPFDIVYSRKDLRAN